MDRGVAIIATACAGGFIALQAPINSRLGSAVGSFQAALVSFAIGTVALTAIAALATGGLGQIANARGLPWYWFLGGLLGAVYVTTILVTVRTLGAGGVTAAGIAGQLAMAVAVDQFGWFGLARHPISVARVVGLVLLALGVWLIVHD